MSQASKKYLSREEELILVESYMECNREAWGNLYKHFREAIIGFIAGRIGDIEAARDLAQDCFLEASVAVKEGKYKKHYRLYTLLRAISLNIIRRHFNSKKHSFIPVTSVPRANNSQKDDGNVDAIYPLVDPEEFIFEVLDAIWLICACGGKPHQVICLLFRDLFQWKTGEIGAELGSKTLGELTSKFMEEYLYNTAQLIPEEELQRAISPLLKELDDKAVLVYSEPEYRECLKKYDPTVLIRDCILGDFFRGRAPGISISDWCNKLLKRAKETLNMGILNREASKKEN